MILYANGCSWTWGGGLDYLFKRGWHDVDHDLRKKLCWPHHLGKLLGATKVENIAEGGGSNQRVVRKTYEYLTSQTKEDLENTIFVIQLTEWCRFELYYPINYDNKFENLPERWIKCFPQHVNNESIFPKFKMEEVEKLAAHRFGTTTDVEDLYRNLGYVYALKGMFNSFNVKNWYLWHNGNKGSKGIWEGKGFKSNTGYGWKSLYESNYEVLKSTIPNIIDIDQQWQYSRISPTDSHPDVKGHKELAQIIYNIIGNKYSNA